MENIIEKIKNIIYHPVRSRAIYDFSASVAISSLVSLLLLSIRIQISIQFLILFPIIVTLGNLLFGLYSEYRLSPIKQKIFVLFCSFLLAIFILYLLRLNFLLVSFSSIFTYIFLILPRIFLNVKKSAYSISQKNMNSKNKIILVTGGGGFIGTVLVEKLLQRGYAVRVIDKFIYGKDVFKNVKPAKQLELIQGDITDPFTLTRALLGASGVIHLAGIVGEPAAALDENLTRHVNIISTQMLKETVKALGISRFIFASTTAVYESGLRVADENSKVKPTSIYTRTKLDSEREILHDTHDSFHPTILRISTAFGHSRKPKFDLVANLFTAQAYYKKDIRVINGNQWRSFIHVADIADAFIKTLEAPLEKVSRQIFNVGDDTQRIQLKNLAKLVKLTVEDKKKINISYERKNTATNYKISFLKIKKTLHFASTHSLESGIIEVLTHIQNGDYKKPYDSPYYSSYEGAKLVVKEFYTTQYRKRHYSTLFSKK
ncbi:MAG TPA: SDR family oxidoreductase [Candidatus Levybacteria bacterium]|nr:SDR family oxidoreductase [Candidatus Levybacteria bacterium]